jgi:hypothetical protein
MDHLSKASNGNRRTVIAVTALAARLLCTGCGDSGNTAEVALPAIGGNTWDGDGGVDAGFNPDQRFSYAPDAGDGSHSVHCGDGICDPYAGPLGGENCNDCPQDCGPCPAGCGDGVCAFSAGETCGTCAADCGKCPTRCGDGACNGNEDCSTCPKDCGTCSPTCGDDICQPAHAETCHSCPHDCGACPPGCGDGICSTGESCFTCEKDCGACNANCGDGKCDPSTGESCRTCTSDCGDCTGKGGIGYNPPPLPPLPSCGDGACNNILGENCHTCPQDCGATTSVAGMGPVSCSGYCGDGVCQPDESCATCYADCVNPINGGDAQAACQPHCGDGSCQPHSLLKDGTMGAEDCMNCWEDCANGLAPVCDPANNSPVNVDTTKHQAVDVGDSNPGCMGFVTGHTADIAPTNCSACCWGPGADVVNLVCNTVVQPVAGGNAPAACALAQSVVGDVIPLHIGQVFHRYRTCGNSCQWNDWGPCNGNGCNFFDTCFSDGTCH